MTKLRQPADLSSHWTIVLSNRWYILLLIGLALFHYGILSSIPLSGEELSYLSWAQDKNLAFVQHRPMVAYWIDLSSSLFGPTALGIRFFSPIVTFALLWWLGSLSPVKSVFLTLLFTPVVLISSLRMSPWVPLALFWTLYLLWLRRTCVWLTQWEADPISRVYQKHALPLFQWLLGGLILGLGALSHPYMVLAAVSSLLLFAFGYRRQAWWVGWSLHLGVALLVAIPVLWFPWNMAGNPASEARALFSLDGNFAYQILWVGAAPLLCLPWALLRMLGRSDPAYQPHYALYMVPFFFLVVAFFFRTVPPEAFVLSYLAFFPLLQRLVDSSSFRTVTRFFVLVSFLPALGFSIALFGDSVLGWQVIPPHRDFFAQDRLKTALAEEVAHRVKGHPSRLYALPAEMALRITVGGVPTLSLTEEKGIQNACAQNEALLFAPAPDSIPARLRDCFVRSETIEIFPLALAPGPKEFQLIRLGK